MIQTAKTFLNYFLKSGVVLEQDQILLESKFNNRTSKEVIKLVRQHADAYIDFSLESVEFYSVSSHQIAAASIYLARLSIGIKPTWPDELAYMTSASQNDIANIVDKLFTIFKEKRADLAKDIEDNKLKIDNSATNINQNQFKQLFEAKKIYVFSQKQEFLPTNNNIDEDNPPLKRTNCKEFIVENSEEKKIEVETAATDNSLSICKSNFPITQNDFNNWFN